MVGIITIGTVRAYTQWLDYQLKVQELKIMVIMRQAETDRLETLQKTFRLRRTI